MLSSGAGLSPCQGIRSFSHLKGMAKRSHDFIGNVVGRVKTSQPLKSRLVTS